VVSSRALAVTAKLGLGALGIAFAIAAAGGVSLAQTAPKPAASPAPAPPAAGDAALLDKGRDIFTNYGCGSCHTLGDAGATGHVGPSLDGNTGLSQDFVVNRVANGQGMMPSFSSQLSADEISALAAYIMKTATK
jgi:mono/diheme cytochrome c family protein